MKGRAHVDSQEKFSMIGDVQGKAVRRKGAEAGDAGGGRSTLCQIPLDITKKRKYWSHSLKNLHSNPGKVLILPLVIAALAHSVVVILNGWVSREGLRGRVWCEKAF